MQAYTHANINLHAYKYMYMPTTYTTTHKCICTKDYTKNTILSLIYIAQQTTYYMHTMNKPISDPDMQPILPFFPNSTL